MVSMAKGFVAFVALVGSLVFPAPEVPRATSVVITAAGTSAPRTSRSPAWDGQPDPGDRPDRGAHARRQPVPGGIAEPVPGLLRQELGQVQGSHPARPRQPRVPHRRRRWLPQLLRDHRAHLVLVRRRDWHLVSLDSNCAYIGGCGPGSPEYQWLAADLASDTHQCTLAYWHHPRYSSGTDHGGTTAVQPFWSLLSADQAELVLTGHEHNYERFARRTAITEFVIGTGGVTGPGYPFGSPEPNSLVRQGFKAVGKFTLNTGGWSMQLVTALGEVKDSASGSCS